ncbi:aromatic-L-amino-acid decarboxylase-like [Odontomachus brunneus]|uniref:aromatic-L-amino-acid decarboxylase-like n=1 Tax=Odontomachus brunneus TaxID=486640 RepID=UPI0013F2654D|nr:aromatic-L-amino-acid decarboxylase-like [Odontomachus brunneus]XP_032674115.1 aromatic-L-amino-acid decarboxylase-like [Odontomachus brunneus]XP_032674116.1 aromatic-L-amino-acid decarboxylase-like [Odontomachus brunneus]XP_032674117.1 aromatic-L-amino-acid decarboxylase-like [Odontomachus brunneus]XP_032674118.1 aromatic-L-amino-acid decarboxylase-like [Odontomachus brunneus]
MDTSEFVEFAKTVIDFVVDYTNNLRDRDVLPSVEPGYLSKLLPEEAPHRAEKWQEVLKDVKQYIVPGMTHWNSPNFYAFYPTGNSYPSLVGEILSNMFGCVGFSWITSPACTELEMIACNWLGKMLGLPSEFLRHNDGQGGGVIQGSASESTFLCLLAAKDYMTRHMKTLYPDMDEHLIKSKLVAYTSDQSNSSVEKAGVLGSVSMRLLPVDDKCSLRGEILKKAIKEDVEKGFIPFYVVATLGTTGTCAFDNLDEIGPICKQYDIWLHIDAAYAAAAFVCPEYRYLMSGVEYADSFNMNAHKWLLVNFDASILWVKDSRRLVQAFNINRIYLPLEKDVVPDYRHWQIPLGRRFRSLKLWFVMRIYGVEGLQEYIKHGIKLARLFESYVKSDDRFEIVTKAVLGLVCFRIKGDNSLTKELLDRLQARKKIYLIAASYQNKFIARFVVGNQRCQEQDIMFAWNEITTQTTEILRENSIDSSIKLRNEIGTKIEILNIETKDVSPKIS